MIRRVFLWLMLVAWLVFSGVAYGQSIPTTTFAGLPGSPDGGDLAFIIDGSGTPTIGEPAAGGGANRDLVAYDATQTRWEFVQRLPATAPPAPLEPWLKAERVEFDNAASGATAVEMQAAIDELFAVGGGSFDDLIDNLTCSSGVVVIPAVTGNYRLKSGVCNADDVVRIADVGPIVAGNSIQMTVINDTGEDLVVDGATNNAVTVGSTKIPANSVFAVIQSDASTIHILGTGDSSTVTSVVNGRKAVEVLTGGGKTLTEEDVLGKVFIVVTSQTLTLPPVDSTLLGLNFCVSTAAFAAVITLDPDPADSIFLGADLGADGEHIISNNAIGNSICLLNQSTAGWIVYFGDTSVWTPQTP